MIPINQTIEGKGKGNCLQASIASILEQPLGEVPDFVNHPDADNWLPNMSAWLWKQHRMGIAYTNLCNGKQTTVTADGYFILGVRYEGDTGGKNDCHAVVASCTVGDDCYVIEHDPQPSKVTDNREPILVFGLWLIRNATPQRATYLSPHKVSY